MEKIKIGNPLMLLLTATIWGVAFVAQSVGMEYVGPFTFSAVRCIIGGIVLLPFIALLGRKQKVTKEEAPKNRKTLWLGGIFCGIILFLATNLQQIGIQYTSVGKAGFITACYIVIVPILSIFIKKKTGPFIWMSVLMAVFGLYLLCINGNFSIGKGDVLILICSFMYAIHILTIDYYSPKVEGIKMACIQFFVCGILSAILMFTLETPKIASILLAWSPILYAGVLSCGVAYTLQIIGQKGMNPTVASLIFSTEASISVLAGWIILGQQLTSKELIGCLIMFVAILLAQLPQKEKSPVLVQAEVNVQ